MNKSLKKKTRFSKSRKFQKGGLVKISRRKSIKKSNTKSKKSNSNNKGKDVLKEIEKFCNARSTPKFKLKKKKGKVFCISSVEHYDMTEKEEKNYLKFIKDFQTKFGKESLKLPHKFKSGDIAGIPLCDNPGTIPTCEVNLSKINQK